MLIYIQFRILTLHYIPYPSPQGALISKLCQNLPLSWGSDQIWAKNWKKTRCLYSHSLWRPRSHWVTSSILQDLDAAVILGTMHFQIDFVCIWYLGGIRRASTLKICIFVSGNHISGMNEWGLRLFLFLKGNTFRHGESRVYWRIDRLTYMDSNPYPIPFDSLLHSE